jgi:hypothetical protein
MDELGKWFMGVFTSINSGGRLGPPAASRKRVEAFLEQVGGEGVLKLSTMLNVGNTEAVRWLAANKPDLGEQLAGDVPQKSLDSYFADRSVFFEPYRKFTARGLSLPAGSITVSFAETGDSESAGSDVWEKVFQLLIGRENDDKESSSL